MSKKINVFLEKYSSVLLVTVLLNAFFLFVVFALMNSFYGLSLFHGATGRGGENTPLIGGGEEGQVIEVVARANPAVVSIVASANLARISEERRRLFEFFVPYLDLDSPNEGISRQVGAGSGFFVSKDGLIVTNRHVVDDDSLDYEVVTSDGESYSATVVAKDPIYDVAILKVEVSDAPFLEFGDSDGIVLGQSVIAIGNALAEFSNSVTKGVVSGLSRSIVAQGQVGAEFLDNVIQTDAGIHLGNSGGPLLNLRGQVIGVNVAVAMGTENIGFALPSNLVSRIVKSVKENGRIVRPFIGVRYVVLNEQLANAYGLPVTEGSYVVSEGNSPAVIPGSPADKAGLKEGDIITEFNGRKLGTKASLQQLTRGAEVGDKIELSVLRGDKKEKIDIILEEAPTDL